LEKKRLKFLLLGVGIVATMGFLLAVGIKGSGGFAYYVTVSEFMAHGARGGDNFRINGKVTEGSIDRLPTGQDVTFVMNDGAVSLPVRYHGIIPDTFVDRADVVVEGALRPDGVFEATTLLAKCPSKYEAAQKAGEQHPVSDPAATAR